MALSKEEAVALKESWLKLKEIGLKELGLLIFHRLLNDHPQVRGVFYPLGLKVNEDDFPMESIRNDPKMVSHAIKIASSLSKFLSCFGNPEEFGKLAAHLGKIHAKHKVDDKYFEYMGSVLLVVISVQLNISRNSPLLEIWQQAYNLLKTGIVSAMKSTGKTNG